MTSETIDLLTGRSSRGTVGRVLGGVELHAPTTTEYRDQRAHDLRDRYRALFGGHELPVPVESIAEDYLGLSVSASALDGLSGVLYPAERRIELNAEEPEARRRFTLAHELGHWICQCVGRTPAPMYCRAEEVTADPGARAVEREANIFAAELLLPEHVVRSEHTRTAEIAELADRFGVSPLAMQWRLYNLAVVHDRPG